MVLNYQFWLIYFAKRTTSNVKYKKAFTEPPSYCLI